MRHKSIIWGALLLIFLSFSTYAQVGINTIEPRTTLEVAGDMNISGAIKIESVNHILDNDEASFLVQTQTGFIEELDASQSDGLVIAHFQEYVLKNMQGDWVKELNTNIVASEYVITIISVYFNQELKMTSEYNHFAVPYCSAFIKNGTWRIVADYPGADPNPGIEGEWVISTLILSKDFSREFDQLNVLMNGETSGIATNPIID